MNKEKLIPKLRFEGFENNEWIPYKLKNIVRFSKGRGYSKNDLLEQGSPIILYGRMYTNYEIVIHNVDTYAKPKENTIYSEGTEVIVPSSGETAEDIARASFVSKKGIILGGDLNIMHLIEEHNPFFLALSISNGDRKKELIRRAQGSSVVHLYNTDLENAVVYFPTLTEQNKISSFLEKIDEMIKLQQSKVNKVKDIKSAYLSEMFPKEGEKYPKKRFEGFIEPWYKNKFNEITEYITSSLSASNTLIKGRYELYDANELIGYTNSSGQKQEYITIIKDGSGVGRVRLLPKDTNFIGTMGAIVNNDQTDIHYIYAYLQQFNFNEFITGATVPHVYYRDYGESTAYHPSYEEQVKIGKLFKNLDNQISIEEEKLSKLEKLKQAYLNDMFV